MAPARDGRGRRRTAKSLVDEAIIDVVAGRGGAGAASFRREKYVPLGGPDGGDGGRGGDVVAVADASVTTLARYRDRRHHAAQAGGPGARASRHGRRGDDLELAVPLGTLARDGETGELLADLASSGSRVVLARGGRGGRGNARFATSTRRAPRLAELGERGGRRTVHLELRLIADVGLVGLPNAGKSTLLAAITGARPRIADYPFTTLEPNLGVAETADGRALVIADVPGLIEGAHAGAGMGTDFLRHLERTRALVHVVDAGAGPDAALAAISTVRGELRAFSPALAERPAVVALNKMDLAGAPDTAALVQRSESALPITAATGEGCAELLEAAARLAAVAAEPPIAQTGSAATHRVYRHRSAAADVTVSRERDAYRVSGPAVERLVDLTDLDNQEAVARLQRRIRELGVEDRLVDAGCAEGDTVIIGAAEFTFSPG